MQRVERHIIIGDSRLDSLCFLSKNLYNYYDSYLGKRIKRGLYRSSTGKILNADLNGAIGILRKVSHESYMQVVSRGVVETPSRILV